MRKNTDQKIPNKESFCAVRIVQILLKAYFEIIVETMDLFTFPGYQELKWNNR